MLPPLPTHSQHVRKINTLTLIYVKIKIERVLSQVKNYKRKIRMAVFEHSPENLLYQRNFFTLKYSYQKKAVWDVFKFRLNLFRLSL
jgi:hypothetical protein